MRRPVSGRDAVYAPAFLFMLLGQREAAVRVLCTTNAAIEGFRPYMHNKPDDNIDANKKCLEAAGLKWETRA